MLKFWVVAGDGWRMGPHEGKRQGSGLCSAVNFKQARVAVRLLERRAIN